MMTEGLKLFMEVRTIESESFFIIWYYAFRRRWYGRFEHRKRKEQTRG
jgi:hypothetical protein